MLTPERCITLRTVRFRDNRAIVSCLTREHGRMSFMVSDGAGREACRRRALMMAGSTFDCIIDMRASRDIQTMRDVLPVRPQLADNPLKTTVVLFTCDFLNTLLRESPPDPLMFDFIDSRLGQLAATHEGVGNWTLCFLIGLQHFMGIEPDLSTFRPGRCFDIAGGIWRDAHPATGRYLGASEAASAALLVRMTPRNMTRFRFTRDQRRRALDGLLDYYSFHFGSLRSLQSLDIIRSVFD